MAEGTKQHFGITVLSSNTKEEGLLAKYSEDISRKGGVPGPVVEKVNKTIGRQLLNSYEETNQLKPLRDQKAFKLLDTYAEGFMSKKGGVGLMGDLGVDVMKMEHTNLDVGLGVRLDTGFNVGKEGARVCFLGMGGEIVLDDVTKLKKKKDADDNEDAEASKWGGVKGIGFQWWLLKAKFKW